MKRCSTVDEYIAAAPTWGSELKQLREILRATELDETVKWGAPCYTIDGKNVVGLGVFKSYFGLWFFQGVRTAFRALTPGKQREYAGYIADAKRPETKPGRLDKILPAILAGKGLYDKYRPC